MDLEFSIIDVIDALRLPYPERGKADYYIPCPCCDEMKKGTHLNINVVKNVFRCPRCGVSGGVYGLYSLFSGVPKEQARQALRERIGRNPSYSPQRRQPIQIVEEVECPLMDIDARHATYTALLNKLSLASDHKQNLMRRGLTEQEIEQGKYKTTPVAGMTIMARHLQSQGLYLAGVPGFFRTEKGIWTFASNKRGILIPVRDLQGRIQGLQIRLDNETKRKYRWVSSSGLKDGSKAGSFVHLAGPVRECMLITEGALKADIIYTLSGKSVLAMPGVHALARLKETLIECKKQGLKKVKTAFDMDFLTNHHVAEAMDNLLQTLDELGLENTTYVWNSEYKGLDDYLWEYKLQRQR